MVKKLRIMGLDAAFANTGIALGTYDVGSGQLAISELRLAQTTADKANKKVVRKNSDDLRRARETLAVVNQAILDHQVDMIFCEVPTGTQSARSAWALGIAVGLIASITRPLIQVTPKEVKDATGLIHPDKADMIAWAVERYPDINWPKQKGRVIAGKAEHQADAVAAIHAGVKTDEFQRSISMWRIMR